MTGSVDEIEGTDCIADQVTHTYDWTELTDEARFRRALDTTPDRLAASIERMVLILENGG